jgi:hypothetical protein
MVLIFQILSIIDNKSNNKLCNSLSKNIMRKINKAINKTQMKNNKIEALITNN